MSESIPAARASSSASYTSSEDSNRSGNSPIDSAKLWPSALASSASSGQAITLSPPAGDAPAMHPSEPMQSSSNGRSSEEMDIAIPCGSMDEVEGVWSQDIEQAFQEAMAIYPPCGRRKIILSDEGKMYGRNELIARYIKIRCGKTRTRKQVSSHIQVLHRKKMRETHGPITKDLKQSSTSPSSMINGSLLSAAPAAIAPTPLPSTTPLITIKKEEAPPAVAAAAAALHPFLGKASPFLTSGLYPGGIWPQQFPPGMDIKNYEDFTPLLKDMMFNSMASLPPHVDTTAVQEGNRIASSKLTLSGFSAYMERARERIDIVQIPAVSDSPFENLAIDHFKDKYPRRMYELFEEGPKDAFYLVKCWANMNFDPSSPSALFAVDSLYESTEAFEISVSTKVITFGSEAVEKRERYAPTRRSDGKYSFLVEGSPLCDYMVRFINELKKSETTEVMERILENFTALMIVTNQETQETLLVVAFVFAVSDTSDSACSIFRLESA